MVEITFNLSKEQMDRLIDAFCARFYYDENSNGLTKPQFTKFIIKDFMIKTVMDHEAQRDSDIARDSAKEKAKTDLDTIS